VVEAAIRSGSLITARLAAEQGREVFAVPGSPLDPRARGCNRLIRDGAALIENAADVLAALEQGIRPLTAEPEQRSFAGFDGPAAPEDLLDRQRPKLEELLGPVPVSVDEILRQCEIAPAVLQVLLLELELAGRLTRHAGHRVSLQPPDQL
jgi:DNA processing protein